jgi:tetratricopeptide (TPR) repeat protein
LAKLSVEQALAKAKSHIKKGETAEAQALYVNILKAFPNNKKAQQGLITLGGGQRSAGEQGPPQAVIDQLMSLYKQGQLEAVVAQATDLTVQFPKTIALWNMLGASAAQIGKLDQAVQAFDQIISLNPNQANAYFNMGNALKDQGKVEEAIEAYNKALVVKPDYEAALNNVVVALKAKGKSGEKRLKKVLETYNKTEALKAENANSCFSRALPLQKQGKLEEAIEAYNKALAIKPDYVEAYYNMGVALQEQGKLEEAIEAYNKVLVIKPDYAEAYSNMGVALKDQGKLEEAIEAYNKALAIKPDYAEAYSNMGVALKDQGKLEEALAAYNNALAIKPDYVEAYYNMGVALQEQGKLEEAIAAYKNALAIKPDYVEAYYNMGVALQEQGKLEEAIAAYNKALAFKPDYAEAYSNMGIVLKEQGKLEEAIAAYNKALAFKPDYAEAYSNMGIVLQDQGKLEEAIAAYNKALAFKPDYAEAYSNMGNVLQEQGKLEEAIAAYNKALAFKPDYAEAAENSQSLAVQLLPIIANYGYNFDTSEAQTNSEIVPRPKYQILTAIKAYLEGDFSTAALRNNIFNTCDPKLLGRLKPKDKIFCNAYSRFIGQLLDANWDENPASENKVYHLGESHSLSYAHRNITIGGSNFRIDPRITFGAKAFHFARSKHDSFKAITKAHLVSLPKNSNVFLSFGEIDCRPNEGFIPAAKKLDKSLEELTDQTTEGYIKWFLEQNAGQKHRLYFVGVPAPVYNKKLTADLNSDVARTVALFNTALKKYSLQHGFDTVDVFKFTAGKEGFSNGLFHIDGHHLGAKALPEIERQLS